MKHHCLSVLVSLDQDILMDILVIILNCRRFLSQEPLELLDLGFFTGFSIIFSNSESRNTESYETRQSWLVSELKNGSVGRVLDTQP